MLKLKLDDAGNVILKDGKPVYVKDDGSEIAFDAEHAFTKIGQLTGEATDYRKQFNAAKEQLGRFEGIEDADAARKAIDIVSKLDQKKLIDAGEVDKVTSAAISAVEAKFKPIVEERDRLNGELVSEKIGGAFMRSAVIKDKFAIPPDIVQARFGSQFKLEDGKVVAYNPDGSKVFSQTRPGDLADFDEALEIIVDRYPNKASILKGTGASGGGAGGSTQSNGNGGSNGKKVIVRSQYDKMSPDEQRSVALSVNKGQAEIRDA